MEEIMINIIPIAAVILLIITFFLSQRIQYVLHALFLLFLGILPILYYFNVVFFTIKELVALRYVVTLVVVMSGRELIRYGMKEHKKGLKQASIALGIALVTITVIPALAIFGSITFNFPEYPAAVDSVLYIVGAILLGTGAFVTE